MSADSRCPRAKCRHSMSGYHLGEWCAICVREGGPCTGEPTLPPRRSGVAARQHTEKIDEELG